MLIPRSASKYTITLFDVYCPSKQGSLNEGQMPCHKEGEKTSTTELQESDTKDQGIHEERIGVAEQMPVFENIFYISKSQFEIIE